MKRKLYRSRADKKIFGVCGGIADYFECDSTIIRLVWVISIFLGGFSFLCYLICAAVIPIHEDIRSEY